MQNYVISLVSANERREHISSEFGKFGINFDFFDAVTPDKIHQIAEALSIDLRHTDLRPGEIACLLSHVMLWKRAIDLDLDFIGIFEDDIHLGEDAGKILSHHSWIPEDGHIIKVEVFYPEVVASMKLKLLKNLNRRLFTLKSKHMGTGGYILSKQVAKDLLAFIQGYQKLIPIDHIMFKDYLENGAYKIYQMSPAVCVQDFILMREKTSLPSSLSNERKLRKGSTRRINKKLMFKDKMMKELMRITTQFRRLMRAEFIIKINFK